MNVSNPRRILAVSLADSSEHLSRVVKDLTGTPPPTRLAGNTTTTTSEPEPEPEPEDSEPQQTLAGTTHLLPLSTAYYRAEVPLWLDLISDPEEWADSFLSEEAREVLEVLGGLIIVFPLPVSGDAGAGSGRDDESGRSKRKKESKELIRHVGRVVREGLGGWEWDGVGIVVGVGDVNGGGAVGGVGEGGGRDGDGDEVLDEWEDVCAEFGMEFVHVPSGQGKAGKEGRNEFGEKMGIPRILEALQANDWAQGSGFPDDDDEDNEAEDEEGTATKEGAELDDEAELDPESLEFGFDRADFEGLKKAIWSSGQPEKEGDEERETEDDVQKLEGMMKKLIAVREMSAGLPEDQQRRIAARAVGEVMREL